MSPSVLVAYAGKRYCVQYVHEHVCKRDSLGRRIRGTMTATKLVGLRVYEMPDFSNGRYYAGLTDRDEAVRLFSGWLAEHPRHPA